ncbi:hypothetical protein HLB35_13745 [Halomonas sp. TBZ9]|uniref:TerD domain-containing protein n=1 Tax=Vreelandella azerica TaxID=2732867 RepID=A0A7Y3TYS1_9GAMM|nr:TerD family protein [Halomonas azerica]NOG32555.1 hypothetical protein [Halomonas azerica]
MVTTLIAGQNAKLANEQFTFRLIVGNVQNVSLDASAILLANTGKVSSDDDFIFFNQPTHPSGALIQQEGATFAVDLSKVPGHLERIAFVLTADPGLSALSDGYRFELTGSTDQFDFSGQGAGRPEKSLIVCELYRRNGDWKVKAVDQGFAGGMAPLAEHFGVEVEGSPNQSPPTPAAAPTPPPNLRKNPPLISAKSPWTRKAIPFRWRKSPLPLAKSISISTGTRPQARPKKGCWAR